MFIVFEGIDGSGKSTQAELFKDFLLNRGYRVNLSAEPTKGPIGALIRTSLSGKVKVSPPELALLFAADRVAHSDSIKFNLANLSDIEISDRYYMSSLVYQSLDGVHPKFISKINELALTPDLLIYIDVDVENALQRINSRNKETEIFENQDFLRKSLIRYKSSLEFPEIGRTSATFDGNQTVEQVHSEIINYWIENVEKKNTPAQ